VSKKRNRRNRELACQYAATVMAGRPNDGAAPLLWSLTVFFESYLAHGSAWTQKPFGPTKAVKLKVVK
jgi:hypothetical protein